MSFLSKKVPKLDSLTEKIPTSIILILFVALIFIRINPLDYLPNQDNGSFLYAGDQILQGNLPYIDFWDSKGPGIFYINALGLWLGKNTRWGIWLLEFLSLATSSFLIYDGLRHKWGRGAALFANILWLYGFMRVLDGGNLTEEYALLFNFWALAYFFKTDGVPSKKLSFLIGFTLALSFLFRANNIGIQISLLLTLFFTGIYQKKAFHFIKVITASFLGAFLPLALVSIYFLYKGLFEQMITAAILYNFYYSGQDFGSLSLVNGLLNIGWPAYIALFGYIALLVQFLSKNGKARSVTSINIFLLISFPIEVVLSSISGRQYPHYFILWMPSIAALGAFVYYHFSSEILSIKFKDALESPYRTLKYILPILLIIYWYTGAFSNYQRITQHLLFERSNGVEKIHPVADFIRDNTEKDEIIYIWGADPGINFLGGVKKLV